MVGKEVKEEMVQKAKLGSKDKMQQNIQQEPTEEMVIKAKMEVMEDLEVMEEMVETLECTYLFKTPIFWWLWKNITMEEEMLEKEEEEDMVEKAEMEEEGGALISGQKQ